MAEQPKWEALTDWRQIAQRYNDMKTATDVPIHIMWFDIGLLCGILSRQERLINELMSNVAQLSKSGLDQGQ